MSHATGEIWSPEGVQLGYFEYNGTSDMACTRVYDTFDEMNANWRADNCRKCTCKAAGEPVILFADYGGGFHWDGSVCWNCRALVGGVDAWDLDTIDGHPFPAVVRRG